MELWDIYDKERLKTGKVVKRDIKFNDGDFHLVVHVCIFNSKNEMLIQQRQSFKEGWPNLWDITVGGSAISGENSSQAAERELNEEIGYKADLVNERPFLTINFDVGFDDYFFIEDDIDVNNLTLQYEEVQRVKWAPKDEIIRLLDNGKFIPYYRSFIEILFDMRNHKGVHKSST